MPQDPSPAPAPPPPNPAPPSAGVTAGSVRLLDVSDLPAPEPLERALLALDTLGAGEALHLRHRREPRLLYPLLEGRGFHQRTECPREGEVHVLIWRAGDEPAEAAARRALPPPAP